MNMGSDSQNYGSILLEFKPKDYKEQIPYGFESLGKYAEHSFRINGVISCRLNKGNSDKSFDLGSRVDPLDHDTTTENESENPIHDYRLVSFDVRTIRVWENKKEVQRISFGTRTGFIRAIHYVASKRIYIAAAMDMKLKIYTQDFTPAGSIDLGKRMLFSLAFNEKSNQLIAAGATEITLWSWFEEKKGVWDRSSKLWKSVTVYKVKQIKTLSKTEWIKGFEYDSKHDHIYVFAECDLYVYNASTGALIDELKNIHSQAITSCLYYPQSHYYLTASNDSDIKVWSRPQSNALVHVFSGHSKAVSRIILHPLEPQELLISCSLDCTIRVQNLVTLAEVYRVALTLPIKKMIVTVGKRKDLIVVCEKTMHLIRLNHITNIFAACRSKVVKLKSYDVEGIVTIACLTADNTIRLFDEEGKTMLTVISDSSKSAVVDFIYSYDLGGIFTLRIDGEINFYSTVNEAGVEDTDIDTSTLLKNTPSCIDICFSVPMPKKMLGHSLHNAAPTNQRRNRSRSRRIHRDSSSVTRINSTGSYSNYSSEGDDTYKQGEVFLIGGTKKGSLVFWNLADKCKIHSMITNAHASRITHVKYFRDSPSSSDALLISATEHGHLTMWSLNTLERIWIFDNKSHKLRLMCIAFSSRNRLFCCGYDTGELKLLKLIRDQSNLISCKWVEQELTEFEHSQEVTDITFYDPLKLLVSGGMDGKVKIWNTRKTLLRELVIEHQAINALAITSSFLLMGEKDYVSIISKRMYLPTFSGNSIVDSLEEQQILVDDFQDCEIKNNPNDPEDEYKQIWEIINNNSNNAPNEQKHNAIPEEREDNTEIQVCESDFLNVSPSTTNTDVEFELIPTIQHVKTPMAVNPPTKRYNDLEKIQDIKKGNDILAPPISVEEARVQLQNAKSKMTKQIWKCDSDEFSTNDSTTTHNASKKQINASRKHTWTHRKTYNYPAKQLIGIQQSQRKTRAGETQRRCTEAAALPFAFDQNSVLNFGAASMIDMVRAESESEGYSLMPKGKFSSPSDMSLNANGLMIFSPSPKNDASPRSSRVLFPDAPVYSFRSVLPTKPPPNTRRKTQFG